MKYIILLAITTGCTKYNFITVTNRDCIIKDTKKSLHIICGNNVINIPKSEVIK